MNLFICKCKDNDQEDKSAMDLLNIKNLENSIKKNEMKIKFSKYNFLKKLNDIDINNLEDDLEIIDYPYKNNPIKKNHNNFNNLIKLKPNIINKNNKIFNTTKENNIQERKNLSNLNSSSVNSESLIEDNIEYLNDEDSLKKVKNENKIILKPVKNPKANNNYIHVNYMYNINYLNKSQSNQKLTESEKAPNKPQKQSRRDSKNKIFHNESLRSGTTKVSTLKNPKKIKRKDLSEKKECHLKNRLNQRFLDNYKDYKEFKNDLNRTFEELSKNKYSPEKIKQIYNSNNIKLINDVSSRNIKPKKTKDNMTKNTYKNKRINKRKVIFKKLDLK